MSEFENGELELLVDLHKDNPRQGPGSRETIEKALSFLQLPNNKSISIADIGCGTGYTSLTLAELLNCSIQSVDFLAPFLDVLNTNAKAAGFNNKINTLEASMDNLPFTEKSLDLIWSEGAIYNMGFKAGLQYWHRFLKDDAYLVVSEITWIQSPQPEELSSYWNKAYPEIDTAANKIMQLEKAGYDLIGYFILPESCWYENYYGPLQNSHKAFAARHPDSSLAAHIIAADEEEIRLYDKYKQYYGYGMYIARKRNAP